MLKLGCRDMDEHEERERWKVAAEVLSLAAEILERDGWHRGEPTSSAVKCVASGVESAFKERGAGIVDFFYIREALYRELKIAPSSDQVCNDGGPKVPYWGMPFMQWNDEEGRTANEAIALLRNASHRADGLACS